jgi:hypothetical protein
VALSDIRGWWIRRLCNRREVVFPGEASGRSQGYRCTNPPQQGESALEWAKSKVFPGGSQVIPIEAPQVGDPFWWGTLSVRA